jgi:hypothetical protein
LLEIKVAAQGVSNVYMYYNPNWFMSSIFLHSTFLMVVSTSLRILYSFLDRKYINSIHLLSFLPLPYSSHMWPPLSMTCFHNIAAFVLGLYSTNEREHMAFGFLNLTNFT